MKVKIFILAVTLSTSATAVAAQRPDELIARYLFPADLVMRHQQEIRLTDKQRATIRAEMKKAQGQFFDLRWDVDREAEVLDKLVRQDTIDEKQVLAQIDKILALEQQLKRGHITLLVRIKNLLTPEQKARLSELKPKPQRAPGHRWRGRSGERPQGERLDRPRG